MTWVPPPKIHFCKVFCKLNECTFIYVTGWRMANMVSYNLHLLFRHQQGRYGPVSHEALGEGKCEE